MPRNVAFTAVLLYVLDYIGTGFWMTAQAETFALIPMLVITDLTLRCIADNESATKRGLVVGLLSALLFLLKYTLLIVPAALVLFLLTKDRIRVQDKLSYSLSLLSGLVVGIGVYVLYLAMTSGLQAWLESFSWLAGYSSIEPLIDQNILRYRYINLFGIRMLDAFSFSLLIAAAIGIYRIRTVEDERYRNLLLLCVIAFGFGIAATLYERKLFVYHFLKVLWAFIPLATIGLFEIGRLVRSYWRSSANPVKRGLLALGVAVFFFYSPLLSLATQPLRWIFYRISGTDVARHVQQYPLREMYDLAAELRPQLRTEDQVFFWGNHVGLYTMLDKLPQTISLTNTPLVTAWTPPQWKQHLYAQLNASPPDYIILEKQDTLSFVTGSAKDSRQHFFSDDVLRPMLAEYDSVLSRPHFDVYRRNVRP